MLEKGTGGFVVEILERLSSGTVLRPDTRRKARPPPVGNLREPHQATAAL